MVTFESTLASGGGGRLTVSLGVFLVPGERRGGERRGEERRGEERRGEEVEGRKWRGGRRKEGGRIYIVRQIYIA